MFSITEEAEVYVADLFEQQDEKDLGLKVDVEKAGTPVATVTFNFCIKSDLPDSYQEFPFIGFSAFIDESNNQYLSDSHVALKIDGVLVTYAAKGSVRRAMQSVGFTVERLPGPPGKREMIRAIKVIDPS